MFYKKKLHFAKHSSIHIYYTSLRLRQNVITITHFVKQIYSQSTITLSHFLRTACDQTHLSIHGPSGRGPISVRRLDSHRVFQINSHPTNVALFQNCNSNSFSPATKPLPIVGSSKWACSTIRIWFIEKSRRARKFIHRTLCRKNIKLR